MATSSCGGKAAGLRGERPARWPAASLMRPAVRGLGATGAGRARATGAGAGAATRGPRRGASLFAPARHRSRRREPRRDQGRSAAGKPDGDRAVGQHGDEPRGSGRHGEGRRGTPTMPPLTGRPGIGIVLPTLADEVRPGRRPANGGRRRPKACSMAHRTAGVERPPGRRAPEQRRRSAGAHVGDRIAQRRHRRRRRPALQAAGPDRASRGSAPAPQGARRADDAQRGGPRPGDGAEPPAAPSPWASPSAIQAPPRDGDRAEEERSTGR